MQLNSIPLVSANGLLKLHNAVREALEADDNTPGSQSKVYGVRDFPDWRQWSDTLEAELDKRGVKYSTVVW